MHRRTERRAWFETHGFNVTGDPAAASRLPLPGGSRGLRASEYSVAKQPGRRGRGSGFSLIELVTAFSIFVMVLGSILTATTGTQDLFVEHQILSQLELEAEAALDRIVQLTRQALTADPQFSPLKPNTGVSSHCLRFRLIQYIDTATGNPVYDDDARVYVLGPDAGAEPCGGVIIGRGPSLSAIHSAGMGPDGVLGTSDDDTTTSLAGGLPAVELVLPSTFAPRTGEMFTITVTPAPAGRLITFNLRLNRLGANGTFIFPNDLVMTERVALRG